MIFSAIFGNVEVKNIGLTSVLESSLLVVSAIYQWLIKALPRSQNCKILMSKPKS